MTIQEPFTVLTDYLLALLTAFFFFRLNRLYPGKKQLFVRFWALTFLMIAAGAFLGGTSHGFKPYFSDAVKTVIWKSTVLSIGLASLFMLAGAGFSFFRGFAARLFFGAALAKFVVFAAVMSTTDRFLFVIVDYLFSMFLVLIFSARAIGRPGSGARWLTGGILTSFAAAAIQQSTLFLGPLNHNDLYHVIQMGACSLLYTGVKAQSAYQTVEAVSNGSRFKEK